MELDDPTSEGLEGEARGDDRVVAGARIDPPSGAGPDQLHAGQIPDLVAHLVRSRDDVAVDQLEGRPPGLDGPGAGQPEHAQGLDAAVPGLGDRGPLAVECSESGVGGVERVALAAEPAIASVRSGDLPHLDTGCREVTRDPGSIAAGAFDPDPGELAEVAHPAQQRPIAQDRAVGVDDGSDVEVLVGVDPADDHGG